MSYHCQCPLWGHQPGCPLGGTGGTITITAPSTAPAIEPAPARAPWECPRCRVVNAPHADRCSCAPLGPQVVVPTVVVPSIFGTGSTPPLSDDGYSFRVTSCNLEQLREMGLVSFTN